MIRAVWETGLCGHNSPTRVIPAKAGIQGQRTQSKQLWIPAFAGMTSLVLV
jgi:hypothetical protein